MQTRTQSLVEQILNVGSGYAISLVLLVTFITPVFNLETSLQENLLINAAFTIISIIRGYFWRRLFNRSFE